MKKVISLILVVLICASCVIVSGCTKSYIDPTQDIEAVASTDKYRNFYQIWIGSFCDSNNDETGDIPGIISKLDYLNDGDPNTGDDLGIDGIWLSPMMPSASYHKYNVDDYYDIDEDFGTLDDFDKLVSECHSRGINIILDLVVNHSSTSHEFFKKAGEELRNGKTDGYAKYYNFAKGADSVHTRNLSNTSYFYEGQFSPEMPDWNLSYQGTRDYFEDVVKFWLDRGVDGFRLDAVKFFTDPNTDGHEFLSWFYEMAQGYNKDVYMVGEDWEDTGTVYDYYKTNIDSLFNFKFANTSGEYIKAARSGQVKELSKQLKKYNDNILKRNENAINANFLTNHDMVRVGNMLDETENKFAAALYLLSPGNSYTYYGEEIGIEAPNTTNDASYRTAMIWDNDKLPGIYVNGVAEVEKNELGGVKQQLADEYSMLNYYRRIIKIKNQNPAIARGKLTDTVNFTDSLTAGYYVEYKDEKLLVIHNGADKTVTVSITDKIMKDAQIRADLVASRPSDYQAEAENWHITLDKDKNLSMPPMSTVILTAKD